MLHSHKYCYNEFPPQHLLCLGIFQFFQVFFLARDMSYSLARIFVTDRHTGRKWWISVHISLPCNLQKGNKYCQRFRLSGPLCRDSCVCRDHGVLSYQGSRIWLAYIRFHILWRIVDTVGMMCRQSQILDCHSSFQSQESKKCTTTRSQC